MLNVVVYKLNKKTMQFNHFLCNCNNNANIILKFYFDVRFIRRFANKTRYLIVVLILRNNIILIKIYL